VIHNLNGTKQNHGGGKWCPCKDAVICNVHYFDFKGPSQGNRDIVPVYYKASYSCTSAPSSKEEENAQLLEILMIQVLPITMVCMTKVFAMIHNNDDAIQSSDVGMMLYSLVIMLCSLVALRLVIYAWVMHLLKIIT